jgi:hypothetical protein
VTALPARRRRRTLVALAAGLAVLLCMPVFGVAAWRAIRDSRAAENVGVIDTLAIPSTPVALLAGVDEAGQVASLTVLALRPEGGGGTVVSVPVGSQSDTSLDSPRRVADAYTIGGDEALVQEMQSLMGVTFSVTAILDESELGELLGVLGSTPVDMPADLRDSVLDADGNPTTTSPTDSTTLPVDPFATTTVPFDPFATTTVPVDPFATTTLPTDSTTTTVPDAGVPSGDPAAVVVVPAGETDLIPDEVAAALVAREDRAPEAERFGAIRAIWDGVAAGIGSGIGNPPVPDEPDPSTIEDFMAELVAGPVGVWQISATPITDTDVNPEGLDLYKVRRGEIVLVMASVAPSAVSATLGGPSAQVDSAFGDSDITLSAVELFAFFNTNVLLIREVEGPPPAVSQVRFARVEGDDEDFSFLEEIIGPFELELVDTRVEGIDFQVTLGESYLTFLDEIAFDPSVTTVAEGEESDPSSTDPAGTDSVTTDPAADTTTTTQGP